MGTLRMNAFLLAEKDLSMETTRQEEKRKTARIMKEPSDRFYKQQKYKRRYGIRSLVFGNG